MLHYSIVDGFPVRNVVLVFLCEVMNYLMYNGFSECSWSQGRCDVCDSHPSSMYVFKVPLFADPFLLKA